MQTSSDTQTQVSPFDLLYNLQALPPVTLHPKKKSLNRYGITRSQGVLLRCLTTPPKPLRGLTRRRRIRRPKNSSNYIVLVKCTNALCEMRQRQVVKYNNLHKVVTRGSIGMPKDPSRQRL
jgi:hypothetical protein